MNAISRFGVNSKEDKDILKSPLTTYTKDTYVKWGYLK